MMLLACALLPVAAASQPLTFRGTLGSPGKSGSSDGLSQQARFSEPVGLAVGSANRLYITDMANQTIRQVTPTGGDWQVTTLAGFPGQTGTIDGPGSEARFNFPIRIAVGWLGRLYVTDNASHTIRELTPNGSNWTVSTIAGLAGFSGSVDGTNNEARFAWPDGIAAHSSGRIYVTDSLNNTVRSITPEGTNWVVKTIAGLAETPGTADGVGTEARFSASIGLAVDPTGTRIYVSDTWNHTVREMNDEDGTWRVSTIAGDAGHPGNADGFGDVARFYFPRV
jgi:sugar lactone lactonase YvrE